MTNPFDRAPQPQENLVRGALFALIIVPVGVVVWVVIWELGFIASIIAFGIAVGAVWLYRKGSGGPVSRNGALAIIGIVVGTLLLSAWAGLVWDYVIAVGKATGLGPVDALGNSLFWPAFSADFGAMVSGNALSLVLGFAFGAIGVYSTLRRVVRAANAPAVEAPIMPPSEPLHTAPPVVDPS